MTLRAFTRPLTALAAVSLAAGACGDLTVPDYNNPSIEQLENAPTPAAVRAAATGLFIGARAGMTERTGYVGMLGVVGRESYTLDGSDPRYVSELLQGPLSNSGAFGAGMWAQRYANIRNANILLRALEKVAGMSDAEKEGIRGFAKTMQAHDFLLVINTRDVNGAPIEVAGTISDVAPFATKQAVQAHVAGLLDEGAAHLARAGGSFGFPVSAGFAGFNTPATFLRFNRALRARLDVYRGDYAAARARLEGNATFLDPEGSLQAGAYHHYSTAGGQPNDLNSLLNYAHPGLVQDAQRKADGTLDQRVVDKIGAHPSPRTVQGVGSDRQFLLYPSTSSPLAVIRNEELLLLRAEARWFTGDREGAMEDLNRVRTRSGGLERADQPADDAGFVTLLLRERRYSLMFEGGHRWIDARRLGRLASLPRDVATHVVVPAWPIPEAECLARNLTSPCAVGS